MKTTTSIFSLAVFLSAFSVACDGGGNTIERKFTAKPTTTGTLHEGGAFELYWKVRQAKSLIATGTTFEARIFADEDSGFSNEAALENVKSDETSIATAKADGSLLTIHGAKAGSTAIRWTAETGGRLQADGLEVHVVDPTEVTITHSCEESAEHWKDLPVVVRYAMFGSLTPDPGRERLWGVGRTDFEPNPDLTHVPTPTSAYEWVFAPKPGTTKTVLTSSTGAELVVDFQDAPAITGFGVMTLDGGFVLSHAPQTPVGAVQDLRLYPKAGEQHMCNTVAEFKATTTTDGCLIKPFGSDEPATTTASSDIGAFTVSSPKTSGECVVNFEMKLGHQYPVAENAELVRKVAVATFYDIRP